MARSLLKLAVCIFNGRNGPCRLCSIPTVLRLIASAERVPHLSQDGEYRVAVLAISEILVRLPSHEQHNGGNEASFDHDAPISGRLIGRRKLIRSNLKACYQPNVISVEQRVIGYVKANPACRCGNRQFHFSRALIDFSSPRKLRNVFIPKSSARILSE